MSAPLPTHGGTASNPIDHFAVAIPLRFHPGRKHNQPEVRASACHVYASTASNPLPIKKEKVGKWRNWRDAKTRGSGGSAEAPLPRGLHAVMAPAGPLVQGTVPDPSHGSFASAIFR
jgi:hypothetical protein